MSNTPALELGKIPIIILHDNLEEAQKIALELSAPNFLRLFFKTQDAFERLYFLNVEERAELILSIITNATLDDIAKADVVIALWSSDSKLLWQSRDLLSAALVAGNLVFISVDGSEPPLGFRQCTTFTGPVNNEQFEHLIQLLQAAKHGEHRQAEEPGLSQAPPSAPPSPTRHEPGEGDDEIDETPDFGSNWRRLGIGRLLVLALVLALFISAGFWMLEAQFKKQQQAARLDPRNAAIERVGSDRPASQEQRPPAGSKERSPTASPSEQTPPPSASAEPESRTAAVIKPASEMRAAQAPAKLPTATVEMAPPMKETEKPRAKEAEANPPPEMKHSQEAASLSPALAVATAICGLEARAGEGQPKAEGADQALILKGAGQAFERRFAEGFIQQSCLVRDLHQKAEQLGEKIKETEEKRDKARERLEARVDTPPSRVSGQKQGNEVRPETKSESEQERLRATVQEQQSLMLTLSAERQRIEAEKIAAEQTLNERLKEQKLAHDFEPLQEKSASGNNIDEPSAQLPTNAVPPSVAVAASPKPPGFPEASSSAPERSDRSWIDTRPSSLIFWLMVPLSLIGLMVGAIGSYKFLKPTLIKIRVSRKMTSVCAVSAFQSAAREGKPQLFISYARKDLVQVKPVVEELERLGVSPWIDWQNIRGGMGWAGEVVRAIRDCNGTIVMCSSAAFRSDDVVRELYIASHFGKPIGPIFLEDATPPDEFLFFLLRPQQMRLFEVAANQRLQKLENYVASVMLGGNRLPQHALPN